MKQKTMYMHTLDGKPAYYHVRTRRIYFTTRSQTAPLASSLRQIQREQRRALQTIREEMPCAPLRDYSRNYGYVRVLVP